MMEFGVWGSGFGVWGLGFGDEGLISGFGFRSFRVSGFGFRVSGLGEASKSSRGKLKSLERMQGTPFLYRGTSLTRNSPMTTIGP